MGVNLINGQGNHYIILAEIGGGFGEPPTKNAEGSFPGVADRTPTTKAHSF